MIRETPKGLIVSLKILPNSSIDAIIREGELIKVKLTAQAIEGKANQALIKFLSKQFKVPKTSIKIIKGETSRDKTILFEDIADKLKQEIMQQFI